MDTARYMRDREEEKWIPREDRDCGGGVCVCVGL